MDGRMPPIGPARIEWVMRRAGRLELEAPRWSRDLPARAGRLRTVQFRAPPPESELEQIGAFMERFPDVELRIYGGLRAWPDLGLLRHFRSAQRVTIEGLSLVRSTEGLGQLAAVRHLRLGGTRPRIPLRVLASLPELRSLALDGQAKQIDVLSDLEALRWLQLGSITLPNLDLLGSLKKVRYLAIHGGSTTDLRPLGAMMQLTHLQLGRIRRLDDLSEISALRNVRHLWLFNLQRVEHLPRLDRCARLTRIDIDALRHLTDLRPLTAAPALRELALTDMRHLQWEHVEVLRDHRTLEAALIKTGSLKRNTTFADGLGYPPPTSPPLTRQGDLPR
jgi:hypothetical protein